MSGILFVTVGTTLFEKLIESVTRMEALDWMKRNGYTNLIVQYGRGQKPNIPERILAETQMSVELYDFKPSLSEDMAKADLVMSHAGAGTVSEVLQLNKPPRLVVVVNTLLMDNHQLELARAMQRRNYIYVVDSPEKLSRFDVWDDFQQQFAPKPPDPTDKESFAQILGSFLGCDNNNANSPPISATDESKQN